MNTLRLHVINSHSPYEVRQNPHDVNSYLFKTDANVEYVISLIENNSIVPSGTYEFGINNPKHNKSPLDLYEHRDNFIIKTAEGIMDGEMNFLAIISRKDNPRLNMVIEQFEETISFLFDEEWND